MNLSLSEYHKLKEKSKELRMKNIELDLEIINELKILEKNGFTEEIKLTAQQRIKFYECDLDFFLGMKL